MHSYAFRILWCKNSLCEDFAKTEKSSAAYHSPQRNAQIHSSHHIPYIVVSLCFSTLPIWLPLLLLCGVSVKKKSLQALRPNGFSCDSPPFYGCGVSGVKNTIMVLPHSSCDSPPLVCGFNVKKPITHSPDTRPLRFSPLYCMVSASKSHHGVAH